MTNLKITNQRFSIRLCNAAETLDFKKALAKES